MWVGKDFWEKIGGIVKKPKLNKKKEEVKDDDGNTIMLDKIGDRDTFDAMY